MNVQGIGGVYKVRNRLARLVLVFSVASNVNLANFISALANTTIKITKRGNGQTINVLLPRSVVQLMEIAAANNGHIEHNSATNLSTLEGDIELVPEDSDGTPLGALQLFGNEEFEITIADLPNGYSVSVNADDEKGATPYMLMYEDVKVDAGITQMIDTRNAEYLAVPVGIIQQAEFFYEGELPIQRTEAEINSMLRRFNPLATVSNGALKAGTQSMAVIPVANVDAIKLTLSADAKVLKRYVANA